MGAKGSQSMAKLLFYFFASRINSLIFPAGPPIQCCVGAVVYTVLKKKNQHCFGGGGVEEGGGGEGGGGVSKMLRV